MMSSLRYGDRRVADLRLVDETEREDEQFRAGPGATATGNPLSPASDVIGGELTRDVTSISAPGGVGPDLDAVIVRSGEDLGSLRIHDQEHPGVPILAAGTPWYMTPLRPPGAAALRLVACWVA